MFSRTSPAQYFRPLVPLSPVLDEILISLPCSWALTRRRRSSPSSQPSLRPLWVIRFPNLHLVTHVPCQHHRFSRVGRNGLQLKTNVGQQNGLSCPVVDESRNAMLVYLSVAIEVNLQLESKVLCMEDVWCEGASQLCLLDLFPNIFNHKLARNISLLWRADDSNIRHWPSWQVEDKLTFGSSWNRFTHRVQLLWLWATAQRAWYQRETCAMRTQWVW